jgi:MFS family permease
MSTVSYRQLIRRNRDFRLFWGGQIVSQLGDWFSAITVQALLLKYTHNATSIAGFMVAAMLPSLLLGPLAGVIVDRLPRKTVMVGADVCRALIALGLLAFRGPQTVWVAYACMAGLSSFTAFFEPARIATLPNITSKEELVTANALSSVTWSILLTSGALVGGIVGTLFGTDVAFLMNSLSFVGSALLLGRMRVPPTQNGAGTSRGFTDLADGFRYVRRHPEIIGALTAKLGWGLAGGVQSLLPIYGSRVYPLPHDRDGQLGISLLFAAGGLGTALGPIVGRRLAGADMPKIRWAIAVSFVMGGVYYAAMAFAPNLGLTAVTLFLARMHGAVVWVFSTLLLQMLVEDRFRGRVFAAEGSLFTATMMLSSVATTQVLDRWYRHASPAVYHTGVAYLTLAAAVISVTVGLFWVLRLARGRLPEPIAAEGAAE